MRLVFNMTKMAKGEFSSSKIGEMQCLLMKPHAEVREEHMWSVQFHGDNKVGAGIERHLAML
jgi:hypothetical protein